LIAISGLARIAIAWGNGLCFGESYYFSCATHPSLSYFDHPPLSMLLGTASVWAAGTVGRLILRAPFIALFAGSTWLVFVLGRRLFGAWAAACAALLLNLVPIFSLSVAVYFQPEGPLMFFSLACVWCLAHLLLGPPPRRALAWWTAAGALLGLAMLSKYAAVLLVLGAGLHVLTRRDQRHWLAEPGPYLALALAGLLFSPVLVWNARHGFISFVFQSTRGSEDYTGFRPDWLVRNVVGQSLALLPWVWVGLVIELIAGFARRPADPARRFIAWLAAPPIVVFTAAAAYSSAGLHHFHWTTPGYLLLLLPLGDRVARGLESDGKAWGWGLGLTALASVLVLGILTTHIGTGWLKDVPMLTRRLEGIEDPTFECVDFTGLHQAFAERGLLGRPDLFVFSDWWFRAGKVDYALGGALPVLAFTRADPRGFAFFDRSDRWVGKDGILVTTKSLPEATRAFGRYFERMSPLGAVDVGRAGRSEFTLYLYRCEKLVAPYPQPYG